MGAGTIIARDFLKAAARGAVGALAVQALATGAAWVVERTILNPDKD